MTDANRDALSEVEAMALLRRAQDARAYLALVDRPAVRRAIQSEAAKAECKAIYGRHYRAAQMRSGQ